MKKDSKIYIAGHNGMVGSAILRYLKFKGFNNLIYANSSILDLRNQQSVKEFFILQKPEYVFLAAAKVGGILANDTYRAEFLYDNLMIQNNVIHQSYKNNVKKLLFLGSSCIYPKLAPQPLKEEYLLSGFLENTNEPYAIAKIAGIKLCEYYRQQYNCNFISAMPCNLYGPNDNYDLRNSHFLPAMFRKFHKAINENIPSVEIWGDGSPLREFLHVDDFADACLFLMQNYDESLFINVGSGIENSIEEIAKMIKRKIGYKGQLVFNHNLPNGTPRKIMDVSRINNLGWISKITLEQGIDKMLFILSSELKKYK
tara:strand:- start:1610 stop:2548 length:939 start_codon:yes stop_codon:yes gene_type:complete